MTQVFRSQKLRGQESQDLQLKQSGLGRRGTPSVIHQGVQELVAEMFEVVGSATETADFALCDSPKGPMAGSWGMQLKWHGLGQRGTTHQVVQAPDGVEAGVWDQWVVESQSWC